MNDLIRCIDTKTRKEKFLPPNVVKDKKLMASYNLIVQDNKENKKEVEKIIEETKEVVSESVQEDGFEEVSKEVIIEKPKRGPKPKAQ